MKRSLLKHWALLVVPAVLIAGGMVYVLHLRELAAEKRLIALDEARQLEGNAAVVQRTLSEMRYDLRYLASEDGLAELLRKGLSPEKRAEIKSELAEEMHYFLAAHPRYDQIRVLDGEGVERLRIVPAPAPPEVSPGAEDPSDRRPRPQARQSGGPPAAGLRLHAAGLHITPFHFSSRKPSDTHFRVRAELMDPEGQDLGRMILRYRLRDLISQIKPLHRDLSDPHLLINAQGAWVEERGGSKSGAALSRLRSFREMHPGVWEEIASRDRGHVALESGLYSFASITLNESLGKGMPSAAGSPDAQLKVVSFVPRAVLVAAPKARLKRLLFFFGLYAFLMGLAAAYIVLSRERRKSSEQKLGEHRECMENIVKAASDGIITIDMAGKIEMINPAALRMFGYEADEVLGKRIELLMPQSFRKAHDGHLKRGQEKSILGRAGSIGLSRVLEGLRKDGTVFPIEITLSKVKRGKDFSFTGIIRDISARVAMEEELRHNAFYDSLTQLPNRTLFRERIAESLRQSKRKKVLFAVLFLDLDRFKMINDSLGHQAGDDLLVALSKRLTRCVRACDTVSRLGGDEMGILLNDIVDVGDATIVAERILKFIKKPFSIEGHQFVCTTSIGIALSGSGYDAPEPLLRDADIAMYRAKVGGRARYEIFDASMRAKIRDHQQLERDLRMAVEQEAFSLHFQPIIALESGRIVHFEALVRWRHPERGMIPPDKFIPLAEECGLIVPLGRFIFAEACRQITLWRRRYPEAKALNMSINVSEKELVHEHFLPEINHILQKTGCDPHALNIEITESLLMENVESINEILRQLKNMGMKLHIDDFGVGYSSLSYLHKFPFDTLKIDASFTSEMCADPAKLKIVQTILSLARQLNMDVICEGIETRQQLLTLKELSCEKGQGYYFSRPLDQAAAEQMLSGQLEVQST